MKRIVLGMTGATGAALGIELLRQLQQCADVETHPVLSRWARATIHLETELSAGDVESLADVVYSWDEQTAAISSGSFRLDGMVIAPWLRHQRDGGASSEACQIAGQKQCRIGDFVSFAEPAQRYTGDAYTSYLLAHSQFG
jgi:polyprenyl P-hydroxybenzoate/phenylacrylic acid decarboxylase-like protein